MKSNDTVYQATAVTMLHASPCCCGPVVVGTACVLLLLLAWLAAAWPAKVTQHPASQSRQACLQCCSSCRPCSTGILCSLLQVSDSGDVLYVLPSNFKQIIAGKSWLLRAEPFFQKVRDASAYLVRVTFGTALITSVVLVWVTIVAILSSSGKDDDRRSVCHHTISGLTLYSLSTCMLAFELLCRSQAKNKVCC